MRFLRNELTVASFTALPDAPAAIYRDGATVVVSLWMLARDSKSVPCAIYSE